MMSIYDQIGGQYDCYRSDIGVRDVLAMIQEMGAGLHVLDLGCGTGRPIAIRVAPRVARYLGVDKSASMLSAFRRNVPTAECRLLDMEQVDVIGGAWDVVFSWGAICHLSVSSQTVTLVAANSLLKPGGRLLFTGGEQPGHCKGTVGPHVDAVDHYSIGKTGYTKLLNSNGMTLLWAEPREARNFTFCYEKMPNQVAEATSGHAPGATFSTPQH